MVNGVFCWVADKTGKVHSGEGKLLLGHAQQGRDPGTADESLAGQHGCGSRFEVQAVPGELALAGGAEVAVDLAGDARPFQDRFDGLDHDSRRGVAI
jgi:hypothetical protein